MYISKLKLQNFRCYEGTKNLIFSEGLNFLVGDNNCGKTTIFRAIEFLISGKSKEEWISKGTPNGDVTVEVVLSGKELPDLLENSELKKYQPYLTKDDDSFSITLRRSSRETKWKPARGKEKEITIKNISLLNPKTNAYENPTGVDSVITALFDPQFVYSDLNNEEYRDFGKTKIVGKLLNEVTEIFRQSDSWKKLEASHKEAFGEAGFSKELHELEKSIEDYMKDQYGDVKVQFEFSLPAIDSFLKTGQILLEDNGIKTNVAEKGTGMQRALAMSLIQVYAQNIKEKKNADKSILFFLDEPETFLHPKAQDRLLDSLKNLASHTQVFITTHSPYLLKNYTNKYSLKVFGREDGKVKITPKKALNLFPSSPTWGEINYFAFGVASEEFHIELYGYLHNQAVKKELVDPKRGIQGFDDWLAVFQFVTRTDENHVNRHDKTMTNYIRNCIDHPGNHDNPEFHRPKPTKDEIAQSIREMLLVYKELTHSKDLPVEPAFAEKKRREAEKKITVTETDDLSMCAVVSLSAGAASFSDAVNALDQVTSRANLEGYDSYTSYLLYVDQDSALKEIPQKSYVIVEKDFQPMPNSYGVFAYNGDIVIRKYTVTPFQIVLKATNRSGNITLSKEDKIPYFGRICMKNQKIVIKK